MKKYAYFLPIGEICIFAHFFIPFQSFFSPNILFGHIFGQTEKYTPLYYNLNLFKGQILGRLGQNLRQDQSLDLNQWLRPSLGNMYFLLNQLEMYTLLVWLLTYICCARFYKKKWLNSEKCIMFNWFYHSICHMYPIPYLLLSNVTNYRIMKKIGLSPAKTVWVQV